jgi:hypothetical protein
LGLKRIFVWIFYTVLIGFLTLLTQVGGVIFIVSLVLNQFVQLPKLRRFKLLILFVSLYLLTTFLIIPPLAKLGGRVPLPYFQKTLQPLSYWTCILNRHYVKLELKETASNISDAMAQQYPGTVLMYLEASFPFIDGYPLLPHLSHNDGKKLDICFFYLSPSGEQIKGHPSPIGYGVFEGPQKGETQMPQWCANSGYWQYSVMEKVIPQWNKSKFVFDKERTKALINFIVRDPSIRSMYIEPHLKERLGLMHPKILFHGCFAVRHDDHIHINLK